jgi:hypothetical protein
MNLTFGDYLANLGTAFSRLCNVLIGGEPDHSLSYRIGSSILRGGLASKIPMPRLWREHFKEAAKWT